MDSSDSEDDCYGNIAQKLQRMKNKYTEDKIESTNLLNDSAELDKIVEKANDNIRNICQTETEKAADNNVSLGKDSDEVYIDNLIASSLKRVTRSTAKRNYVDVSIIETTTPKKSKKRKTNDKSSDLSSDAGNTHTNTVNNRGRCNNSVSRGRGRNMGRNRERNRETPNICPSVFIPTYSIGNTDEYPDQSDSQALFSKPKLDEVILVEENEIDENEELSVKVYWQSSEFFKFTIRRYQKLIQIFDYFAKKENISNGQLLFTFNERILKPDDTPDSIDYSIVKFIDGGVVNQSVSKLCVMDKSKNVVKNGIKIKFQCQNFKKPFELTVCLDEKFSISMMKCAEHLETSLDKLKFEFDGDTLSGKTTARELDLEGGECIDVRIMS